MTPETIRADAADAGDRELDLLAFTLAWEASLADRWSGGAARFLFDLADQLRLLAAARQAAWWQLEQTLDVNPGEPARRTYPPGHRQPDEPAYGL